MKTAQELYETFRDDGGGGQPWDHLTIHEQSHWKVVADAADERQALDSFIANRFVAMRQYPEMHATTQEAFGLLLIQLAEILMLRLPTDMDLSRSTELPRRIFGPENVLPVVTLTDETAEWCVHAVDVTIAYLREISAE